MAANIGAELKALPLEDMLSAPLNGVIKAQALAARTTVDFIQQVGMTSDSGGALVARTVEFQYEKPTTNDYGEVDVSKQKLTVPLLSIVPIPFIRVQEMTVDFEFNIKDTITQTFDQENKVVSDQTEETERNGSVSFGGWFWGGKASGSYKKKTTSSLSVTATSKNNSTSTTDRSAKLAVQMKAVQDQMPEGLSRVLTILNDAIASPDKKPSP